jgi:hypothetical protein
MRRRTHDYSVHAHRPLASVGCARDRRCRGALHPDRAIAADCLAVITVELLGAGSGRVVRKLRPGLSRCVLYANLTTYFAVITGSYELKASARFGSTFVEWGGACAGTDGRPDRDPGCRLHLRGMGR